MCYKCSTKWRYEFNHTKSGVVTFGETKPAHFEEMKEREWILGDGTVDELYEHKNLSVLKNYASVNSKRQHHPPPGKPPGFCTYFQPGSRDLYHLNCPGVARGSALLSVINKHQVVS